MMSPGSPSSLHAPQQEQQSGLPFLALVVLGAVLLPVAVAYGLAVASETLVVAAVLAVLGVLVILARPFWGLVLFVALLFIRPEEMFPSLQGARLTLLISLVTLVGTWVHLSLNREALVKTPLNGLMLGLGFVVVVSTLTLGNTSEAAQEIGKPVVLVLLVLNLLRTPERYRIYSTALVLFTAYLALFSIVRYFSGIALQHGDVLRSEATGIFGDPNDLAATLTAGLPIVVSRIRSSRGLARFGWLALAPVFLVAILLTRSRGGLLALMAVTGGSILLMSRQRVLAVMAAVVVCGVLFVASPSRMTSFDSKESSANGRFWYWSDGTAQFLQRPVLGLGYGQFPEWNDGRMPHNSFVLCYAELGLAGYFCWLGCIYYAYRRRPRREGEEDAPPDEKERETEDLTAARLSLLGLLVASFFLTRTYIPSTFVLISLPMAVHVAYARGKDVFPLKPGEAFADGARILGCCLASIAFIKIIADLNK